MAARVDGQQRASLPVVLLLQAKLREFSDVVAAKATVTGARSATQRLRGLGQVSVSGLSFLLWKMGIITEGPGQHSVS